MFTGDHPSKLAWLVTVWLGGCGQEASAPAVAPEFDDPFAGDATPAAPAAAPAEMAEPAAVAVPAEVAKPAEVAGTPEPAVAAESVARRKPARAATPVPQDIPPAPAPAPVEPRTSDGAVAEPASTPAPAPASTPAPLPPVIPGPERFAGSFTYVGGQAQRDQVAVAIEATVMALNVLFRPIARKRITAGNPLREQISFAVVGKTVSVSFGADRKISGLLEGAAVPWTDEAGSPLEVTFSLVKGRIIMHCQGEGGARRNVFTLDESGDKLTMSVTMSSDRLPVPVKYALTYRRK